MRHLGKCVLAALVLTFGPASHLMADAIPYPTPGIENPVIYTFTATATGDVVAYFAGSTASFENTLGLNINGVSTGIFGLDNQTTPVGTALILGSANIGDTLTFVMHNVVPGLGDLFSDPTMNGPYDGGASHNHVYSTLYTSLDPFVQFPGVPPGTFVAFEDLPNSFVPDWNYNDENFVFTNVSSVGTNQNAPLPSTAACGGLLLVGLLTRRSLRRQLAAA